MPPPAAVGPQSGRTPRSRALEVGTSPQGFEGGPGLSPSGQPAVPGVPAGTYRDSGRTEPVPTPPAYNPTPFK